MRIALLFVFLLNSVCGDGPEVNACIGGWFEFKCRYQRSPKCLEVHRPRRKITQCPMGTIGENIYDQQSVYHNTTGKYWRVHTKRLTRNDFGEYECKNGLIGEIDLKKADKVCSTDSSKISYEGSKTSINCPQTANFICKSTTTDCDTLDILDRGSVYTINNVSLQDGGVYWCGYESTRNAYRVSRQKIWLQVMEVSKSSLKLKPGEDLNHQCKYTDASIRKFVCKGETATTCEDLSTSSQFSERFSLQDKTRNQTIIFTIQNVTTKDSGFYWCGIKRIGIGDETVFFHKLELTVEQTSASPSPTLPAVTKTSPHTNYPVNFTPTLSPNQQDELVKTLVIVAVVCFSILLLALIGFCAHRRLSSFTKTTLANKEENFYEEIQERTQQAASGTALKTIYATATVPIKQLPDDTFKDNVLYSVSY